MVQRRSVAVGVVAVGLVLAGLGWPAGRLGAVPPEDSAVQPKPKAETSAAWTAGEVLTALAFDPQDSYLQYVALQLARREDKVDEVGRKIDELNARPGSFLGGRRERGPVDLFSLFTGALAVQESLQLDTMRGQPGGQAGGQPGRLRQAGPVNDEQDPKAKVSLDRLAGPAVKSHPWDEMLGDQKPEISPLARCVPADFYFIDFRSLNRLLDAVDAADSWGTHLFDQAYHEARTQNTGQRVKTQLVMETNALLRPVYDLIVDEVAVTGSDPFLREGSDVTMLFRARQPGLLKARMDGFLANAEKARADIKRSAGRFLGVDYVHLATADRAVCVYSAYPRADLHVRGNSLPAFKRVLETILGRTEENGGRAAAPVTTIATTRPAGPLGESAEFRYIRTLFPTSAAEEDGLVYLSDPFIRRLVGPQCKLTELHRIQCYNHLRMIGHAALLYHTENGRFPKTLAELAAGRCVPGEFGQGELVCPDGGTYSLSADGSGGVCSIHGHVDFMTPCCEIPLTEATASEADSYRAFLEEYKTYWRVYFDPIAVRLQVRPDKVRVETIVLPLIDNSIYTTLAGVLNGKPEPLETLPVPKRTIFAMAARFDKAAMVAAIGEDPDQAVRSIARDLKVPDEQVGKLDVRKFITEGIGNQVALNVYDADPMFDFNLPGFLGEMLGSLQPTRSMGEGVLIGSVLISSLNAPVYLAVPVQDAKIVDEFLDQLDGLMALAARQRDHRGWFPVDNDFYKFTGEKGQTLR